MAMTQSVHRIYIFGLAAVVLAFVAVITFKGYPYYKISIEERFFHPDDILLKPSGLIGHGIGILGSLCMIIGVSMYMVRKRYRIFSRWGLLKYWLEFHIFLCTIGPIMVLFHTSFKFGGIVAISFWSMVAVFLSGIIGRFIYLQIPRTIEGRELSLTEVRDLKRDIGATLINAVQLDPESHKVIVNSIRVKDELFHKNYFVRALWKYVDDLKTLKKVKSVLRKNKVSKLQKEEVIGLVKNEISLNRKIERLANMQELFKYWHVVHMPFALVMLVIMVIHVVVTIVFGYRWIF